MIFLQLEVWKFPFESELYDFRVFFASELYFPALCVLHFAQLFAEIEEERIIEGTRKVPDLPQRLFFITCYLEQ